MLLQLRDLADREQIGLILKSVVDGRPLGATYVGNNRFLTDRSGTALTFGELQLLAASADAPLTFTAVVRGTGARLGIDRDVDGIGDGDESRDLSPDVPGYQNPFDMVVNDATGNAGSMEPDGIPDGDNDFDGDGVTNKAELLAGTNPVENLTSPSGMEITSLVVAEGSESVALSWSTTPGGVYLIEYSSDLIDWKDAGDGEIISDSNGSDLQWEDNGEPATDEAPSSARRRYYRVRRVR